MADRPILFSAPMVRALLAGTKTQTRRVVKPQPPKETISVSTYHHPDPRPHFWANDGAALLDWAVPCPYGQSGDKLWVREAWRIIGASPTDTLDMFDRHDVQYRADDDQNYIDKYRPSIHMPRWASRITLEVTGVRVERLQDISRGYAMAEGCPFPNMADGPDPRKWYADLWDEINGAGSWDANPWVWVIEFKRAAA